MAGRPARPSGSDEDGWLGAHGADPSGARGHSGPPSPRGEVQPAGGLRLRHRHGSAAAEQRNVARALREAQKRAVDAGGQPTFAVLHETDSDGKAVAVPRGVLPSMHSFRHMVASRALLAGESVDEVAFLLGHRDGTITRTVYVREVADARRRSMRRSRMAAEYADALKVALETRQGSR